jgi:hypothetical protein
MITGCGPGFQPMDILAQLQYLQELSLDNSSKFAWAQADVKQYFDNIQPLNLCRVMVEIGIDIPDILLMLKLHMLPQLNLVLGDWQLQIDHRTVGVLTGSRTASLWQCCPPRIAY